MGFWASFPDHNGICVVLPFNGSGIWQYLDTNLCSTGTVRPRFFSPPQKTIPNFSLLFILGSDVQNLEGGPRIGSTAARVRDTDAIESISVFLRIFRTRANALQPKQNQWLFPVSANKMRKIKWACGLYVQNLCYNVTGCRTAFTSSPAFRSSTSTLRRGSWALHHSNRPTPSSERKVVKTAPQECDRDQHREYPSKHRDQKRQCHGWRMIQNPWESSRFLKDPSA